MLWRGFAFFFKCQSFDQRLTFLWTTFVLVYLLIVLKSLSATSWIAMLFSVIGIRFFLKKTDPSQYLLRTWFYINLYKTFIVRIKITNTFFFILENIRWIFNELWTRIRFQGSVVKTDPVYILLNIHLAFFKRKQKF